MKHCSRVHALFVGLLVAQRLPRSSNRDNRTSSRFSDLKPQEATRQRGGRNPLTGRSNPELFAVFGSAWLAHSPQGTSWN